ncbi:hypothetical protein ACHAXM_007670 [Skeletonema potamos]
MNMRMFSTITVAGCVRIGAAFPVRRTLYFSPASMLILRANEETTLQTRCFATAGSKETVGGNDDMHRKHYSISGVGRRSKVTCKTDTNHTLEADVPKKMGGGDEAPQPVEHLLTALLGCTQATAVYVGRMMQPRLIIDKIDFKMEAYRDERGALSLPITELPPIPARLERVTGSVVVHFKQGTEVSEEQLRILGRQTEARCPVANMMHASGCVMDIQWKNGANLKK